MSLLTAQYQRNILEPRTPRTVYTTSDQTLIGSTFADVTGLTFAIEAGKTYDFEFKILADSDATTTGIDVAVSVPASPTRLTYIQEPMNSATAIRQSFGSASDNNSAQANSAGATVRAYTVRGQLVNGANAGSITARIKREAVGTGPNVRAGSVGYLWQLN